jgi:ketosteroid isomerase-like protein
MFERRLDGGEVGADHPQPGDRIIVAHRDRGSHVRRHVVLTALLLAVAACTPDPGAAESPAGSAAVQRAPTASDSADVARAVERFHEALASGDSAAALALLAPGATVLESGGEETVAEYRAHHLPADIEYARAVSGERGPMRVTVRGDVAWASSTSRSRGTFKGRPVDSAGAELMVLTRAADGWRIAAIHWSSRRRAQ